MFHTTLIAAFALTWSVPAASQGAEPAPRPRAEESADEQAARAARLREEHEALTLDLRQAIGAYQATVQDLVARQVPQDRWPAHPNAVYFPRFEALALQDQPDALRWCLGTIGQIGVALPEVVERKNEYYARLVVLHPDLPWMADLARWLQAEGTPTALGFERADELLRALADGTRVPATRAAALSSRSALLKPLSDPKSRAERRRLLEELAGKHGDTHAGASARGELFQMDHLKIGAVLPDVEAVDVEGRAFRLSDYRGKVVVLDFWGFW